MATGSKKKPLDDAALWDKLQADAELERIKELAPSEVSAEIRADGGDPNAIGRRGAEMVAKLLAARGADWTTRAKERRETMDRRVGGWPTFAAMPRAELLARLRVARADTRLSAPVVAAFRKRGEEEASDDELRAILEEIEVLARLHGTKDDT